MLSEEELAGLLWDAEAIFEEFSQIQELGFPDSVETVATGSLMREDIAEKFPDGDRILGQVPKKEGRLIRAPKSL